MNQEGYFLYFLKNFPAWIPLLGITLVFAWLYFYTNDVTYREWTGLTLSALFTALGMQRSSNTTGQSANTTTGNVIVNEQPIENSFDEMTPEEIETVLDFDEKK